MSQDDYTPARLRELADKMHARASYNQTLVWSDHNPVSHLNNASDMHETAAALRAAADTLAAREALEAEVSGDIEATRDQLSSAIYAGANQADIERLDRAVWKLFDRAHALRLTFRRIDALNALLRRAMNALNAPDATIPMRTRDGVPVDVPAYTPEEARDLRRALAAEIAAALGGKTDE